MYVFFFCGLGGASSPASGPTKPWPHWHRVSIPSVGLVLISWIRRRCCRYPYSSVLFSLAAKGLGVPARHCSIFGRTSLRHLRLLFLLRGRMWARTRTHTHARTHIRTPTSARTHARTHAHTLTPTCSFVASPVDLLFLVPRLRSA